MIASGKSTVRALALMATALGVVVVASQPANARVRFGIGIGVPGPVYYGRQYYADPCESPRFRYYHPGVCCYPDYYDPVYYGPPGRTDSGLPIHLATATGMRVAHMTDGIDARAVRESMPLSL